MTSLRLCRSASIEANGAATAIEISRTTPHTPTAVAPPTPYAQTVTAVAYAQSPIIEPANARLTRRSPGLRKTVRSDIPVSRTALLALLIRCTRSFADRSGSGSRQVQPLRVSVQCLRRGLDGNPAGTLSAGRSGPAGSTGEADRGWHRRGRPRTPAPPCATCRKHRHARGG